MYEPEYRLGGKKCGRVKWRSFITGVLAALVVNVQIGQLSSGQPDLTILVLNESYGNLINLSKKKMLHNLTM